jgi:hypothetical protein
MTTGLRESRPAREEARGALWTGIGCMVLSAVIVFGFLMMVIQALPDP